MLRACHAVMSGHCPKELAASKMGPLNNSRWVTMALRVLMFYMTFENPPEAIQKTGRVYAETLLRQLVQAAREMEGHGSTCRAV